MPNLAEARLLKAANAIAYWLKHPNTKYVNLTNAFKLIHYLDFIHTKRTGRPFFSFTHLAQDYGPVPEEISREVYEKGKESVMWPIVSWSRAGTDSGRWNIVANKEPDMDVFTKAEIRTLEDVAFLMAELTAKQASESTHGVNGPWHHVYHGVGKGAQIDISAAFDIEGFDGTERELDEAKESFSLFRGFDAA